MKKKYSRFRELWAVPKYQTLFKLGGYLLFFIIFFLIASIGSNNKPLENKNTLSVSYNTMKKNLSEKNLTIKYTIDSSESYYFEGTIINNILTSTVETNDEIKKIKIIDDKIYLMQKNEEIEDNTLFKDLNLIYLFPENILNILNNHSSLMKQTEDKKTFSYLIDNKSYSVYLNEDSIQKIIVLDGIITYTLVYSIIK